jgi:hypothetical protein
MMLRGGQVNRQLIIFRRDSCGFDPSGFDDRRYDFLVNRSLLIMAFSIRAFAAVSEPMTAFRRLATLLTTIFVLSTNPASILPIMMSANTPVSSSRSPEEMYLTAADRRRSPSGVVSVPVSAVTA